LTMRAAQNIYLVEIPYLQIFTVYTKRER
jgi:hypothetical protein